MPDLDAIRARLAQANNLPCPENLPARVWWLRYRADVTALLAALDAQGEPKG